MGILYLVRHGQASFLEPNYDKLSRSAKPNHAFSASTGRNANSHSIAWASVPAPARKTP